ncbi:recombinase-like helix-turn-helix domain-containing protein [Nitratireductor rhodophyticola]|uniref:recombinase-like helix-turn-helix domain-containing protein n=1 Tax=Nitratireductor rhodophyticola TaxID=2854036 RepID=UPI0030096D9E
MDAFKDRLSQRAFDTGRPGLEHQCRGRELDERENALADALMTIYATGEHDFSMVARQLAEKNVVAPRSGRTDWTEALLAEELQATNRELDAAYEASGYGA